MRTPTGFKEAYRQYVEAGWPALGCDPEFGGQGLPIFVNNAMFEMLNSANQAWTMYPGLSHGAQWNVGGNEHVTPEQKSVYLPKLVSGVWTGTMCLTEPHCGTDLGILRTKAEPNSDGSYAISGTKIFISSGEHDLAENIVHLVLARLPGAPIGTKGISLFIVPKFVPTDAGEPGERNGVKCGSIEHKMGIHGNSTCVINLDNAQGWLVGEPNKGLNAMFVMMNAARLGVGMQGLGLTEIAYQNSLAYAKERLQMRSLTGPKAPEKAADPIIVHPDVRRMLLTQKAYADNARDIDLAIRWGFGWNEGPFEGWQSAGWTQVAKWVQEDIEAGKALSTAPLPAWVFDGPVAEKGGVHTAEGSWSPQARKFVPRSDSPPVYEKQVFGAPLAGEAGVDPKTYGRTLFETDAVRAWVDDRAGEDDVVIVSFKSKMNTIGPSVIDGLTQAIALAEKDFKGVVIWQPTSLKLGNPGGAFSAGANLEEAMPAFMTGGAKGIEPFVKKFQQGMLRVKYASVPVVSAVSGIALGGGCELVLHSAKRVAHIESYIGLVEVGVGLVPAGGGLKEAALRAAEAASAVNATSDLLKFVQKSFENAAMAKVSASALDARAMGYLKPSDTIVFNVHELLDIAKKEARALERVVGYRPPLRVKQVPVAGRSAISTIKASLVNMRDGRFISDHDYLIASRIAEAVCGGGCRSGQPGR